MRVSWLTNAAAPYRLPVWRELAAHCELSVWLMAPSTRSRRWSAPAGPEPFGIVALPAVGGQCSELALYLLRPGQSRRASDADVVVLGGWESPASWQVLASARARRVPTVAFYESTKDSARHPAGAVAAVRRAFFRSVNAVLVPGAAAFEAVAGFGVPAWRVVQTVNAVDVAGIHASAALARARLGPPGRDGHVFAYVGQLIPRKQVDLIIDAYAEVRDPADRLLIVGEGPLEAQLRSRAAAAGVGRSVRFQGYCEPDHLPALLAGAHTLVLASHREVWGLVVNEALAAGLHAVSTDLAGVTRTVRQMAGVFPYDGSPGALRRAMRESRAAWRGPLAEPEILAFTPGRMARGALAAVELALRTEQVVDR